MKIFELLFLLFPFNLCNVFFSLRNSIFRSMNQEQMKQREGTEKKIIGKLEKWKAEKKTLITLCVVTFIEC